MRFVERLARLVGDIEFFEFFERFGAIEQAVVEPYPVVFGALRELDGVSHPPSCLRRLASLVSILAITWAAAMAHFRALIPRQGCVAARSEVGLNAPVLDGVAHGDLDEVGQGFARAENRVKAGTQIGFDADLWG